ncbi:MAG: ankyrin repeat domain-containing protein [Helicobacter sp.]|nr:ankyrin repeat domain-containing protein [Helicobacteraceae bacterium]MDY3114267.1 ankyrin repeat domain-containing protein [Helicobacter sp.]
MQISDEEEKRYQELCEYAFNFARNNESEELEKMIKAGLNVNLKNHKGNSLLMLASYNGALECAKMLLKQGARVDERNDKGQTPLAGVCFKGDLEMAKLLVENGADIDANNGLGLTPYSFALLFGKGEIAKFLLDSSKKRSLFKRISAKMLGIMRKS